MSTYNKNLLKNIRKLLLAVSCFLAMTANSSIYSQTIIVDGMYLNAPYGLVKYEWNGFKKTDAEYLSVTPLKGGNASMIKFLLEDNQVDGFRYIGVSEFNVNGKPQFVVSHQGLGSNSNLLVLNSMVYTRGKLYSINSTVILSAFISKDQAIKKGMDNLDYLWLQLSNLDY